MLKFVGECMNYTEHRTKLSSSRCPNAFIGSHPSSTLPLSGAAAETEVSADAEEH